jgi:hypothetical protein
MLYYESLSYFKTYKKLWGFKHLHAYKSVETSSNIICLLSSFTCMLYINIDTFVYTNVKIHQKIHQNQNKNQWFNMIKFKGFSMLFSSVTFYTYWQWFKEDIVIIVNQSQCNT